MILITHITIAIASLICAGLACFYPSRIKPQITFWLVGLTLATGFFLVWQLKPVHMAEVCISGLVYLGLALSALVFIHRKLALENTK